MTAETDPRLIEVGLIGKAHGLKGEVVVDFSTDRIEERTDRSAALWIGQTEHRVVSARPHQRKWLVRFDGVEDRNAAEALRGSVLRAEAFENPDVVFVNEVIGKALIDQQGTDHGPIVAVVDNPASDLMELADGRLVPMAFLVEATETTVVVTVPAGLLDES